MSVTPSPTMTSPVCKEVASLSDSEVSDWINSFDTVMTDCDGVLWVGAEPIPGSPEMINRSFSYPKLRVVEH